MYSDQPNGIVIGIVSSLEDPKNIGRVRVLIPCLDDQETYWARLVTMMAGPDRGTRFVPEVDDEVLVAFEMGDRRRPYILGSVWNTNETPPADDGNQIDNNWRYIKSRSGHILRFDDTDGAEKIEILDKDNAHKVIIDTSGDKIDIICETGDINVYASSGKIDMDASEVVIHSSGTMDLIADGVMTIKGSTVDIN